MNWSIVFFVVMMLLLLRILRLRIRANSTRSESFKRLPPKDQLAVLKECLLNNPSEANLRNLADFSKRTSLEIDVESYRPFLKSQLEIFGRKDAIADDNELYAKECEWMDAITPLEFEEAKAFKQENETQKFIERTLEGIARLYSDDAILNALSELAPDYPHANELAESYRALMQARDESLADDKSLEKLRKQKEAWEEDLLNVRI
ncbi:hypothetical protein [Fibrobacter sp. UWB11]|uniref:hypothetical protein n=1 Tax=Fibrobacter sp. UWB11 TaxID=1896202 RepID=UPI00092672EA|nr:hypothetical protein [Fibrobacter sp. UWB11]SIO13798.1 hypothetical protein SAMN05720758_1612 [Fibrobacter sp. UWB11]